MKTKDLFELQCVMKVNRQINKQKNMKLGYNQSFNRKEEHFEES